MLLESTWLKYRGHLENISQNCLIGAINSANGEANNIQNQLTGEWGAVPKVAAQYRDGGVPWVVVGDYVRPLFSLPSMCMTDDAVCILRTTERDLPESTLPSSPDSSEDAPSSPDRSLVSTRRTVRSRDYSRLLSVIPPTTTVFSLPTRSP